MQQQRTADLICDKQNSDVKGLQIKNKTFTSVADKDGDVITDISTSKYALLSVVPLYKVENARKNYWFPMIGAGSNAYLIKIFSDSNTIVVSENIAMRLIYIEL